MVYFDDVRVEVGDSFDKIRESRLIIESIDTGFMVESNFGKVLDIDFEGEARKVVVEVVVCEGNDSGETFIEVRVTDSETGSVAYAEDDFEVLQDSIVYVVRLSGEFDLYVHVRAE